MKEKMNICFKILKYITIAILIIITFILVLHFIGSSINRKVPSKGINESMYVCRYKWNKAMDKYLWRKQR